MSDLAVAKASQASLVGRIGQEHENQEPPASSGSLSSASQGLGTGSRRQKDRLACCCTASAHGPVVRSSRRSTRGLRLR
jgi:hypothetical protein